MQQTNEQLAAEMNEHDNVAKHGAYTIADLRDAFSEVCPAGNWKVAIDAKVSAARLAIVLNAIPFMVGGSCKVTPNQDGSFRVQNAGYYVNIGA